MLSRVKSRMSRTGRKMRGMAGDTRGAANIEYALIATLIAIGSLAALTAMADSVIGIWSDVEEEVTDSMSGEQEAAQNNGLSLGSFKAKGAQGKGQGKGQEKSKDKGK